MEKPPPAGEGAPSLGGDSGGCSEEHGVRERTCSDRENPRNSIADRTTRYLETAHGILSYSQLAPLLADKVAEVEALIISDFYDNQPLDEALILDLHQRICGELVPEWSGKWRDVEVRVGNLKPPYPYQVAQLMRDYIHDLDARLNHMGSGKEDDLLELLAFAEGRFLTIHPFKDFNGRVIRLFLIELLRRLDLPMVHLAANDPHVKLKYFHALEAADEHDWSQLVQVWRERFEQNP